MKNFFYIQKYALWQQSKDEKAPDVSFVPPLMRRRLNTVEKIGLYLAHELEPLSQKYQVVFASRFGEWQQTINLIDQMFREGEMSPAGFSHSVHNATPGLLSILDKSHLSYTAVSAGESTIESGLLETFSSPKPIVFIYAEEATPDFYKSQFGQPITACGAAFVLYASSKKEGQKVCFTPSKEQPQKSVSFKDLRDFLEKDKKPLLMNGFVLEKVK